MNELTVGPGVNELKKKVFFEMLDLAGRVFILVSPSENVIIGKRGFLPEEKEKGIILVFNRKMNFTWDDDGISATLVFGSTPEKCLIPPDNVLAIFSPELDAHFSVSQREQKADEAHAPAAQGKAEPAEKVIKVDFKKKR